MQVFVHIRNRASYTITQEHRAENPESSADDVVDNKTVVFHFRRACHCGNESPYDRHKTRDDNGFGSMLFIKLMGAFQVNPESWISIRECASGGSSDEISGLISNDRGDSGEHKQPHDIQLSC